MTSYLVTWFSNTRWHYVKMLYILFSIFHGDYQTDMMISYIWLAYLLMRRSVLYAFISSAWPKSLSLQHDMLEQCYAVNNFVQHCYTWLRADWRSTILFSIVIWQVRMLKHCQLYAWLFYCYSYFSIKVFPAASITEHLLQICIWT